MEDLLKEYWEKDNDINQHLINANVFCGKTSKSFFNDLENELISKINQEIVHAEVNCAELSQKLFNEYLVNELEFEISKKEPRKCFHHYGNRVETSIQMPIIFTFKSGFDLIILQPNKICKATDKLKFNLNKTSKILGYELPINQQVADDINCFEKPIEFIRNNVENLSADINEWNNQLESLIDLKLENYSNKQESFKVVYEQLNVVPNADLYLTPQPTKKTITYQLKPKVVPTISDKIYDDIITTLKYVGRAIEKKPRIYLDAYEKKISLKKADKEDYFRDIFLLFLETRYVGITATGETFNKDGKTDIILKSSIDGSNLFIAECKIWYDLEYVCNEAIEQLLGYVTIRDTKTALLIFVKDGSIIDKIEKFKGCMEKNKYCKSLMSEDDQFIYTYKLENKDDSEVEVILKVLFFYFPKIASDNQADN